MDVLLLGTTKPATLAHPSRYPGVHVLLPLGAPTVESITRLRRLADDPSSMDADVGFGKAGAAFPLVEALWNAAEQLQATKAPISRPFLRR